MTTSPSPVIAVIDDDTVYQFTASRTLQATRMANQILQFTSGKEALAFLKNGHNPLPDIIFLDINMPVTDGWTFLEEFHNLKAQLSKEIRIYMVSSSIDPRDRNRAKNYPEVAAYMEKPISMNKFSEVLLSWGQSKRES
ncbi:MAG: response regulator [Cyclobacteriaceae bacterium]|nr:response regulator [Cyclobacteriaceae bacterium]